MNLQEKLAIWEKEGLISNDTASSILRYEKQSPKQKTPLLLVVGLIFLALALFSFVAANWSAIPHLAQIGLVVALMWIFYLAGSIAESKNPLVATIFRIMGLISFYPALLLTLQNIEFALQDILLPWIIFLMAIFHDLRWKHWAFGAVAFVSSFSVFITSNEQFTWTGWVIAVIFALIWLSISQHASAIRFSWLTLAIAIVGAESGLLTHNLLFPIWGLFALLFILILFPKKRVILQPFYLLYTAIALLAYLSFHTENFADHLHLSLTQSIFLAILGVVIFIYTRQQFPELQWIAVLGLVGLTLFDSTAITLAVLVELVALGYLLYQHRKQVDLTGAFAFFILVQLVIYFIYAWNRLNVSFFFLIGAVILLGLSFIAWRLNRKKEGESA